MPTHTHTRTRYITYVSHTLGDRWQWTAPKGTPAKSVNAAVNMFGARRLEDLGIDRNFPDFGKTLRLKFPEIVEEAQQYIGETREIELPEGMKPKEFQRAFHEVQCTSEFKEEKDGIETQEGDE